MPVHWKILFTMQKCFLEMVDLYLMNTCMKQFLPFMSEFDKYSGTTLYWSGFLYHTEIVGKQIFVGGRLG